MNDDDLRQHLAHRSLTLRQWQELRCRLRRSLRNQVRLLVGDAPDAADRQRARVGRRQDDQSSLLHRHRSRRHRSRQSDR